MPAPNHAKIEKTCEILKNKPSFGDFNDSISR